MHFGTLNAAGRPHVFGNTIFLDTNDPLATWEGRVHFAHELPHVFQDSQHLVQHTSDAVGEQFHNEITGDAYDLDLLRESSWIRLGTEQQAYAVELWQQSQIEGKKVQIGGDLRELTKAETDALRSLMQQAGLFDWRPSN